MDPQILAYIPEIRLGQIAPFVVLTVGALLVLALDALLDFVKGMTKQTRDRILLGTTALSIILTGVLFWLRMLGEQGVPFFEGMFRADEFGYLGTLVVLFGSLAFVIMAPPLIEKRKLPTGELCALLLFAVLGMVMLTVANELITAFICIEITALSLYVMAGMDRRSLRAGEAAFKYFLLGAFSSAFLVMGIAFLFGATGTTQLFGQGQIRAEIAEARAAGVEYTLPTEVMPYDFGLDEILLAEHRVVYTAVPVAEEVDGHMVTRMQPAAHTAPVNPLWIFLGFGLIFVGLCFKLSLAPFHMWTPDVYAGSPTIVAMFIATASKVSAFAFLVHLVEAMAFWQHFPIAAAYLISAVAVASIVWGNTAALMQTNFKRMLAYSSIAHGGYLTIGVATLMHPDVLADAVRLTAVRNAMIFYLFAYTLMNVLAFGTAAYLGKRGEGKISNYRGLFKTHPYLAVGMAISMISLVGLGIPGTVGFWGKYYVFKETINAGLVTLAIIAMIGSAVSAWYYLRVVVAMFMQDEDKDAAKAETSVVRQPAFGALLAVSSALIFVFGFLPPLLFLIGGTE